MKIYQHIPNRFIGKLRRAYTLIEISVVLVLIMLVASTLTTMLHQQLNFVTWLNSQNFLVEKAPITNNMMVRILSQADAFRIHNSKEDALSDVNGVTSGGSVLVLGFSQPDGSREYGLVEFSRESGNNTGEIRYYTLNQAGDTSVSSWRVSSGIADVQFGITNGVLIMELTGPFGGTIKYAASSSL